MKECKCEKYKNIANNLLKDFEKIIVHDLPISLMQQQYYKVLDEYKELLEKIDRISNNKKRDKIEIINEIEKIRKQNNECWLTIYELIGIKTRKEIFKIQAKRLKNNKDLMNSIKIIFDNKIEKGIDIFKEIAGNDTKINLLFKELIEK